MKLIIKLFLHGVLSVVPLDQNFDVEEVYAEGKDVEAPIGLSTKMNANH